MPFKYAHYFVGFVLLVTLGGFWASYFTRVGHVPLAFHVHAFSATSWLSLLIVQSWAIQNRHNQFHRLMGKLSFLLFPLLITGFVMIINVSAARFVAAESPFIMELGPAFGIGMVVAMAAYLVLYYQALKNRRSIRLHAGYMLATPLILFESPFSRLMDQFFPWMIFTGTQGPRTVLDSIAISDAMVVIFAMTMYFRDRKNGAPWLIASLFVGGQAIIMSTAYQWPFLNDLFYAYGQIPEAVTIILGLMIGAFVTWAGWRSVAISDRNLAVPVQG